MEQYISKDALVAEIERRIKCIIKEYQESQQPRFFLLGKINGLENIRLVLETLEMKEVDFDAEWEKYFEHRGEIATINVKHLAKHFFERGLKVKGE